MVNVHNGEHDEDEHCLQVVEDEHCLQVDEDVHCLQVDEDEHCLQVDEDEHLDLSVIVWQESSQLQDSVQLELVLELLHVTSILLIRFFVNLL